MEKIIKHTVETNEKQDSRDFIAEKLYYEVYVVRQVTTFTLRKLR